MWNMQVSRVGSRGSIMKNNNKNTHAHAIMEQPLLCYGAIAVLKCQNYYHYYDGPGLQKQTTTTTTQI